MQSSPEATDFRCTDMPPDVSERKRQRRSKFWKFVYRRSCKQVQTVQRDSAVSSIQGSTPSSPTMGVPSCNCMLHETRDKNIEPDLLSLTEEEWLGLTDNQRSQMGRNSYGSDMLESGVTYKSCQSFSSAYSMGKFSQSFHNSETSSSSKKQDWNCFDSSSTTACDRSSDTRNALTYCCWLHVSVAMNVIMVSIITLLLLFSRNYGVITDAGHNLQLRHNELIRLGMLLGLSNLHADRNDTSQVQKYLTEAACILKIRNSTLTLRGLRVVVDLLAENGNLNVLRPYYNLD
eukprot:gene7754-7736_t